MIQKTIAFQVGERFFPCIEEAQQHGISAILIENRFEETVAQHTSQAIMDNREKILDILTMTPDSRPKARKINGGTKKRRKKDDAVPANPESAAEKQPF